MKAQEKLEHYEKAGLLCDKLRKRLFLAKGHTADAKTLVKKAKDQLERYDFGSQELEELEKLQAQIDELRAKQAKAITKTIQVMQKLEEAKARLGSK